MKKLSYKEYLSEYYKYFDSFSEVVNKEGDKKTKIDAKTSDGKKAQLKQRDCEEIEHNDGEEDYDPCKFRQWMEISVAGD